MLNYIETRKYIPFFTKHYLFLDTPEFLAAKVFARLGLKIKIKQIVGKTGCQYIVVFCSVRKKDVETFKDAMQILENNMYLYGKLDYKKEYDRIFGMLV